MDLCGQTFGISIDPGDVDELMKHMGEAREAFMRTEPSRGRTRNDIGWRGADDRAQPAFEKGDCHLSRGGASLVRVHCPGAVRLSRLAAGKGGGSIALEITRNNEAGWKFRVLLNPVEGTIQ